MSEAKSYISSPPSPPTCHNSANKDNCILLYATLPLSLFVQCIGYEKNGVQLLANKLLSTNRSLQRRY